ncbi:MAG: helicase [Ruminiclostridium sp.]|nr:helicase [Ruminiclostridium sp.]
MDFDNGVWKYEKSRLEKVLEQIDMKLKSAEEAEGKVKNEVVAMQKSMWDNVNPTPGGGDLDDLANIWQFQTDIEREGRKALFAASLVKKLKKMRKTPYFGRIDFKEDGSAEEEKLYIGIASLIAEKTHESLVYDWRAPVASMFYDYETGRAAYDCPAGRIEGEILLKRQYRIWEGKIDCMFDCSLKIDDEILQEILGKSADSRMKVIVTSIQREQNRIIRNDLHKLVVVQGPAGSGKTSIALHRIAYLLYRHRGQVLADNIVIFSPNGIFNDYISNVLPELGEENMHRATFMEYARWILGDKFKTEDMGSQMEYMLTGRKSPGYQERIEGIKYKASTSFVKVLKNYLKYFEDNKAFEDIEYNGVIIETKEEIREYFIEGLRFLPPEKRLIKIRNRLVSKLEPFIKERIERLALVLADTGEYIDKTEIKGRSTFIAREEFRPLREKIEKMTRLDLMECYIELFNDRDLFYRLSEEEIPEAFNEISKITIGSISSGNSNFEDVGPLLLLNSLLSGVSGPGNIKHVIIDEVQDYTPIQFEVFKLLFSHCSMTMLGDLNQSINPYMNIGEYKTIMDIFGFDPSLAVSLSKSYRSTKQITEFCRELLVSKDEIEYVNRSGELPRLFCLKDEEAMLDSLGKNLALLKANGSRSIAVICRTAAYSCHMYEKISYSMEARLVKEDTTEFIAENVISIIPSYLAKGLEFDAVLVLCANSDDYAAETERKLLYTCCTRALHRLYIYSIGKLPEFVSGMDGKLYEAIEI